MKAGITFTCVAIGALKKVKSSKVFPTANGSLVSNIHKLMLGTLLYFHDYLLLFNHSFIYKQRSYVSDINNYQPLIVCTVPLKKYNLPCF